MAPEEWGRSIARAISIPNPDGKSVVISNGINYLSIPLDGSAPHKLKLPRASALVAFSPDGKSLAGFFRITPADPKRRTLAILAIDGTPIRGALAGKDVALFRGAERGGV